MYLYNEIICCFYFVLFVCFFALVLLSCTECPDIKCRQKSHKYTKSMSRDSKRKHICILLYVLHVKVISVQC